jgi:hypothetical protein
MIEDTCVLSSDGSSRLLLYNKFGIAIIDMIIEIV